MVSLGAKRSREYEIARTTFERVRGAFPALTMTLDPDPEHVDLSMDISAQPGLGFDVNLNLQNVDELHLETAGFWVGWFPRTDPERVDAYFDAVSGRLSGWFRILEHKRGRRVVRAELQRPGTSGWETVATSSTLWVPWPRKSFNVVQNVATA